MEQKKLKDVKKGEFFVRRESAEPVAFHKVFFKGEYDKSSKKWSCIKWSDANYEIFLNGECIVYTGFEF